MEGSVVKVGLRRVIVKWLDSKMTPAKIVFSCLVATLLPSLSVEASNMKTIVLASELQHFVETGTRPIEVERADLNGDGLSDYLLVLEKLQGEDEDDPERERILLIIVRKPGGALEVAGRSDSAVRDDQCGGTFGDCFQGVSAKRRMFVISEFGGSGWRWNRKSTFKFSSRDQTWQLVRVEEESFGVSDPSNVKRNVYVPPRDFGKIDISEYDPLGFLGEGAR
jgi:hypothetical protein